MAEYRTEAHDTDEFDPKQKMTATKATRLFTDSHDAQQEYRRRVVDNLKMLAGEQWPQETLDSLPPGMAPIVINKMVMPILFLSGVQRQTRQEPKLLPFEGGDARATELMNALVHWHEQQYHGTEMDSQVFLSKIAIGMGWWKYTNDYDSDPEGNIRGRKIHPLRVFPDPNWLDASDWKDAEYVIDAPWYSPAEAEELWPEHKGLFRASPGESLRTTRAETASSAIGEDAGDSLATRRLFFDPITKRIRIPELWYKDRVRVTVAVDANTGEVLTAEPERIKVMRQALKLVSEEIQNSVIFTKRTEIMIRVAYFFNETLLEDTESPYEADGFPLFPSLGIYFWKDPNGLADLMHDLQLEKNKRRSKMIEMVSKMPGSGFMVKNSETATAKQVEEYASGEGTIIGYDQEKPEQIKPPEVPMALVRLEDKTDEELKDVPNVHDELLGQATQKTISGKAIQARQRGGLVSHEHFFDSMRIEKAECIKFLISLIKQYVTPAKALRILGTIAQRQPDGKVAQMLPQGGGDMDAIAAYEIQSVLSQAFDTDYDVVISSRPAEPSLAMQAWETMLELKNSGADMPPKIFWESAMKAGIITEGDVQEILEFIQGQMQAAQGVPPAGPPPASGQVSPAQPPAPAPPPGPPG